MHEETFVSTGKLIGSRIIIAALSGPDLPKKDLQVILRSLVREQVLQMAGHNQLFEHVAVGRNVGQKSQKTSFPSTSQNFVSMTVTKRYDVSFSSLQERRPTFFVLHCHRFFRISSKGIFTILSIKQFIKKPRNIVFPNFVIVLLTH